MSYAGESIAKKIARARAYEFAVKCLPADRRGRATVLALAGPEAGDLGPIRAFGVTDAPADVMLVDLEEGGLRCAAREWPGVHVFHGPLHEARPPWPVDLAVLDWCGHGDTPLACRSYRAISGRLRFGSVIVVTYLRGRESDYSSTKRAARVMARDSKRYRTIDNLARIRPVAIACAVSEAMGLVAATEPRDVMGLRDRDPVLADWGSITYRGHASPMGIGIFTVRRKIDICRAWRREEPVCYMSNVQSSECDTPGLLREAERLAAAGVDAAAALAVSRGTLAAWKAHKTMGSYGE